METSRTKCKKAPKSINLMRWKSWTVCIFIFNRFLIVGMCLVFGGMQTCRALLSGQDIIIVKLRDT